MKKIILIISSFLIILGCSSNFFAPQKKDFVGTWINDKNREVKLTLFNDGSFKINNFPNNYSESLESTNHFSGTGSWDLYKRGKMFDQLPLEIILNFNYSSDKSDIGRFSLIVSGEGILENKPPYNQIFIWKEEEGGERFYLYKTISNNNT